MKCPKDITVTGHDIANLPTGEMNFNHLVKVLSSFSTT